jgi:amino acid permease
MYAFQIFSALAEDTNIVDEVEIYWLIPIMLVVTPFVYFIRVKLFDKYVLGIDLEAIDAELKQYKEKERLQKDKEAESKVHRAQG